jgi:transmembrane sensor
MASHASSTDAIRDRAAYWVTRVNDNDLTDGERDDLQTWLLADPRHAAEFRAHNALLALARELPTGLRKNLDLFVPLPPVESRSSRRRWVWPASLAATALVATVTVGGFKLRAAQETQAYATRTGQNLTIRLEDGSVATLNTRTKIEWRGGKSERRVYLHGEGEAMFTVVHDPTRPFVVMLDNSEIRVLGTRFNVYQRVNGEVTVTVMEGKVAVRDYDGFFSSSDWHREVSKDQQIVIRADGAAPTVRAVESRSAVEWLEGKVAFRGETLPEMINELQRYTDKRIVTDGVGGEWHSGGLKDVRDMRGTLDMIAKGAGASVIETDDAYTLQKLPEKRRTKIEE